MFLAGIALVAFARPGTAQVPASAQGDLRCLVIGLQLASDRQSAESARQAGDLLASYYLGRLHPYGSPTELEQSIYEEGIQTTPAHFATERQRCVAEFQGVGAELITMGNRLEARANGAK
jgi:hypothetical protein